MHKRGAQNKLSVDADAQRESIRSKLFGDDQNCNRCGFYGPISSWNAGFVPSSIVCPKCGELHDEKAPGGDE